MIFALRSIVYLALLFIFWAGIGCTLSRWLDAASSDIGRHSQSNATLYLNGQQLKPGVLEQIQAGFQQCAIIPLNLKSGQNILVIKTNAPDGVPAIGFSNPRFILPTPTAGTHTQ